MTARCAVHGDEHRSLIIARRLDREPDRVTHDCACWLPTPGHPGRLVTESNPPILEPRTW